MGFKRLPTHLLRDKCIQYAIKDYKRGKFLEIGAGSGLTTRLFLKHGFWGVCFDMSEKSRRLLKDNLSKYKDKVEIIDKLKNCSPGTFDYLFSFDVLEHIKDDETMLQKWSSYLKDGGICLISVPAHANKFGRSDEMMGHIRRYEKKELTKLLSNCGYKDIKVFNYGFPLVNFTLKTINFLYGLSSTEKNAYGRLSASEKTIKSGVKNPAMVEKLSFVFNNFTVSPFVQLQKLFFDADYGVGYVACAKKY